MSGNIIYCQSCDRTLQSEILFDQHCKSKKHEINEQLAQEQDAAKRKIFVRNFDGAREPYEFLKSYFSRFGSIQKIELGGKRGNSFAFVEFQETAGVQKVISQKRHCSSGMVLYVKKFVFQPHRFGDKRLIHQQREQEEKRKMAEAHHQITEQLMSAENLPEQISMVAENSRLDPEDKKVRAQICKELTKIFSPYFESFDYFDSPFINTISDCMVYQFGSSVNGFGAKGCDLDLFLDFQGSYRPNDSWKAKPQIKLPTYTDLNSMKMLSHGPLTAEFLRRVDLYDVVKLLSRILSSKSSNYSETLTIPSQRCPVVKFTHKVTGLKCDLSLNNRKALHNSHLLRLYGTEPRVHRLVSAVRLWMRAHELSGSGSTGHLLTSYAVTLIVMFYVMQRKPRLVPLVCDIADCVKGAYKERVDDWECVSIPDEAVLPPTENTETDLELLKGFFDFCANSVNWNVDALITRNATTIQRGQISRDPTFMGCKVGCLTVLDPFVLTHNVAGNVNEKTKLKFVTELKRAAEITHDWPPVADPETKSKPWGLAYLMAPAEVPRGNKPGGDTDEGPKKKKGKGKGQGGAEGGKAESQPTKVNPTLVDGEQDDGEFFIALSPLASILSCEKLASLAQQKGISPEMQWCSTAQQMVLDVMQSVFMIELKEVEEEGLKDEEEMVMDTAKEEAGKINSSTVRDVGGVQNSKVLVDNGEDNMDLDQKGENMRDKSRSSGSSSMGVVVESQADNALGKRSSAAAHLDSSSSESIDASDLVEQKARPSKHENPKKKLCGGVHTDAGEVSSKTKSSPNCGAASSQAGCYSTDKREAKTLDSNRKEMDDVDTKVSDHPCKDDNVGSVGTVGGNTLVLDNGSITSRSLNTTQEPMLGKSDKFAVSSTVSLSSSTSTSAETTSENDACSGSESTSALSSSCGDMPSVQVFAKSSYSCSCRYQMWMGRKILRSRLPSPWKLSGLLYEQELSKLVLKEREKAIEKEKAKEQLLKAQAEESAPQVKDKGEGEDENEDSGMNIQGKSLGERSKTCKASNQPSSQPSNQLKSHPTSQPSKQLSSQSSSQSSSQPSNQPSSQSNSQSSAQPSNQLSSQPTKSSESQKQDNIKSRVNGRRNTAKKSQEVHSVREDFVIEFTCQILQQSFQSADLPHILIKMRPTSASISSFKNLFCSFRSMIIRLLTSNLFDQ